MYDTHAHWRDSARNAKFFVVDARIAWFLLLFLVHMRWWTFILATTFIAILIVLDYLKMPLTVSSRIVLGYISGKKKVRIVRSSQ
jgi:intracellular multiplication protein IcmT